MSVGFFMSIKSSYIASAKEAAQHFIVAANLVLAQNGLPAYTDPSTPPDVYEERRVWESVMSTFGRSSLDHFPGSSLKELADFANTLESCPQLRALGSNPYRIAFLPIAFTVPLQTTYEETIGGRPTKIYVGSAPALLQELEAIAPSLGIAVSAGHIEDSVIDKINNLEPLVPGDRIDLVEKKRPAWLLLYEGARLAVKHHTALSLAG